MTISVTKKRFNGYGWCSIPKKDGSSRPKQNNADYHVRIADSLPSWKNGQSLNPTNLSQKYGAILTSNRAMILNCRSCHDCNPIRVNTKKFTPSKSQKRILKRGAGFTFQIVAPEINEEHYLLHARSKSSTELNESVEEMSSHIINSTHCVELRDQEQNLIAHASIVQNDDSLYALSKFYDPELTERHSLGVLMDLKLFECAKESDIEHVYLGLLNLNSPHYAHQGRYNGSEIFNRMARRWQSIPRNPTPTDLPKIKPT